MEGPTSLHEQLSETWSSPNEFMVTERERSYIGELVSTDERIGREVAAKYGRGTIPKRPMMVRLIRRAQFELKKIVGPAARKAQRFARRQWNRRVIDHRRVVDGTTFVLSRHSFVVVNLTSETAQQALADTSAEFVILTREPNALLKSALQPIAETLAHSNASMWFGDSRNTGGVRERRSQFTRLLLRQVDALGPVVIVRAATLRDAIRETATQAAELWPLAVGLTIAESEIELIPEVLGVGAVTVSELGAAEAEATALVRSELMHSGLRATVEQQPLGRRSIAYALIGSPLVSIVIPTRGTGNEGTSFVVDAVRSIIHKSTYDNFELVIVADDPTPQPVVDEVERIAGDKVRWVRWSEPFNFSSKMNLGAACAAGEYLLFLNDDIEVVLPNWIERMLSLNGVDEVAYIGALLFFEDQTIQHAGHVYMGGPGHIGFGEALRQNDSAQLIALDRVCSGVTAACSLMRKELFARVGGFSTAFPSNYNDVDLGLKVLESGYRSAVSGGARLYHFESKTRDARVLRSEIEQLHLRWVKRMDRDFLCRSYES